MTDTTIYRDIALRTGGEIFVGVVGPVRTGKSTLIKRFIQNMFLPVIDDEYGRERAKDEMPQSASGRTVMTTEPKFVPEDAADVKIDENTSFRMKMIDCVGYIVDGATGHEENGAPRMVMTPWSENPMPFDEAAEIGTKKVIADHSTIAICVTSDGSICDIPRESYIPAEKRVIDELKALNKPFITVLNSTNPESEEAVSLAKSMQQEYKVPVLPLSCIDITENDIKKILSAITYEFPVREINFKFPGWIRVLDKANPLSEELEKVCLECAKKTEKLGQVKNACEEMEFSRAGVYSRLCDIFAGKGSADILINLPQKLFYSVLSEKCGFEIDDERDLLKVISDLSAVKKKFEKYEKAIDDVNSTGYGIVNPSIEDLTLEEPEIVKQASSYGVRFKASGPSVHLISAKVQTQVSPSVGTERESAELVRTLLSEFEQDPLKLWNTDIFGKSLREVITEGMNNKLSRVPSDAREKLSETLGKIINEGSGGLICILL